MRGHGMSVDVSVHVCVYVCNYIFIYKNMCMLVYVHVAPTDECVAIVCICV